MRLLIGVCIVVASAGIATAQQHSDTRGLGFSSCAEYAKDCQRHPQDIDDLFLGWALGFISGANATRANDFYDLAAKTSDEMKRFFRQYRNDHPLANYIDGVVELRKSLPTVKRSSQ